MVNYSQVIESPDHTVWVMDRGGQRRIAQVTDLVRVIWRRVRDDISYATVDVSLPEDSAQAEFLAQLVTAVGRYEIAIWRGDERVWEGPITLVTFPPGGCSIDARDVMFYAARNIMRDGYDNTYPNTEFVTTRARLILEAELGRRELESPPINVVPHIVEHHTATDARTSAKTLPYQFYTYEHIDTLAADRGMDYTVVGRSIHLWDTHEMAMGQTPTVTENDFLGPMYVSIYGLELGTISAVTDGQGTFGVVDWDGNSGDSNVEPHPYYGGWERLETAYDEQATAAPTQAELESQAVRNLDGRWPTPMIVRVPDNSQININGVLTIADLVPGVFMPMLCKVGVVEISQMQKLQTVVVTEDADGEKINVVMYPAPGVTAA